MSGSKVRAVVGGAAILLLIGMAAFIYVRSPDTLTLDRFSAQSLEPWPDGVGVVDSWSGMEGPGGGDTTPEAESLYLLVGGEAADLRGHPLLASVADHPRSQGWHVRSQASASDWATTWGTDDSPTVWFHLGLPDDYLDSGRGRGVERSNEDLGAAHGSDTSLVVLQVTASD